MVEYPSKSVLEFLRRKRVFLFTFEEHKDGYLVIGNDSD
jgi:hypothetical protein